MGFGRAHSDGLYRAVYGNVVVAGDLQRRGLGRQVVETLLNDSQLLKTEWTYLMTSNSAGFYKQLSLKVANNKNYW